jgi:hypothetical protein
MMMVRLSNCGSCHHGIVTMSCRPQQAYIEREICLALWKGLSCCKRSPWKLKFQPHSTRVTLENFLLLWCIGHGRPWEAIAKVFDLSYLLSTQALSPSLITYCLGKVCGIKMQVIENNMGTHGNSYNRWLYVTMWPTCLKPKSPDEWLSQIEKKKLGTSTSLVPQNLQNGVSISLVLLIQLARSWLMLMSKWYIPTLSNWN